MAFFMLKATPKGNPTSSSVDEETDAFEPIFIKSPTLARRSSDDDTVTLSDVMRKMFVPVSSDGAKKAEGTSTDKPKSKSEPQIRMDWFESSEAHILNIALPGLKKEDVKLQIEGERTISVSGELKKDPEKDGSNWHCRELLHGSFSRKIELPEKAKVDQMKAEFQNGVLKVTVPKPVEVVKNVAIA